MPSTRILGQRLAAVCLCAFIIAATAVRPQSQEPWYNQPQFLNYLSGYEQTIVEPNVLIQMPFTGQGWGIVLPTLLTNTAIFSEINRWRGSNAGAPYFLVLNPNGFRGSTLAKPEWQPFRAMSLDGSFIGDELDPEVRRYTLSGEQSAWRDSLRDEAKRAVDLGATGLLIVEADGPLTDITRREPSVGGSFDDVTMLAFRKWLEQFSTEDLLVRFGISNLAAFNYKQFIVANNLGNTWNSLPLSPLASEFFRFRRHEMFQFLRDLSAYAKAYAKAQGKEFFLAASGTADPIAMFAREVADLSVNEAFYIRGATTANPPFPSVDIRSVLGLNKPVFIRPQSGLPSIQITQDRTRLIHLMLADIMASGALAGTTTKLNLGLGPSQDPGVPLDPMFVNPYANFILSNAGTMTKRMVPARIGLLDSVPSRVGRMVTAVAEPNTQLGNTDYIGMARLLLNNGYSYTSVYLPDSRESTLPWNSGNNLAQYPVVIAPSTWSLSDLQFAGLLAYVNQGGTLIVSGSFGNSQADGFDARPTRPNLSLIPSTPGGIAALGAGKIVRLLTTYGLTYQNETSPEVLQQISLDFRTFLNPYVTPDVEMVNPGDGQFFEPAVIPFLYRDTASQPFIHVVNYDYSETVDQFIAKTNVTLRVRVGTTRVDTVRLISPIASPQNLTFTRFGEFLTVSIPTLTTWAVLELNRSNPLATPGIPQDLAASVNGSTVSLTWTPPASGGPVSGFVVQAAFTPGGTPIAALSTTQTSLTVTAVPNGKYFVRVRATNADGSGDPSNEVIVQVGPPPCGPPDAPTGLTGIVNGFNVTLNWTAPAAGCPVIGYRVLAGSAPGLSNLAVLPVAGTTLNATAPPGVYYVRVVALSAEGTSGPSNEATIAVACDVPGSPSGLTVNKSGLNVTLTWSAPSTGGTPSQYILEAGSAPTLANLAVLTVGSTSFSASAPPGTYYVRVRARNVCGVSGPSSEVIVTLP